MDEIVKAWTKRQSLVKSARFSLSEDFTLHAAWAGYGASATARQAKKQSSDEFKDTPLAGNLSIIIQGNRYATRRENHEIKSSGTGTYFQVTRDTFDGTIYKSLREPASSQQDYGQGGIRKTQRPPSAEEMTFLAVMMHLRGVNQHFFNGLADFSPTQTVTQINGVQCVEIIKTFPNSNTRELMYLAPTRDFAVMRAVIVKNHTDITWQFDVDYTPDNVIEFVPKRWSFSTRGSANGPIIQSGTYKVEKYEINPDLREEEFELSFPPGTHVLDRTTGRELQSVIDKTGEHSAKVSLSANPTYEQLRGNDGKVSRTVAVILWSSVSILAVGGVWFFRRRRMGASKVQK
jgi:hypothetical protein